MGKSQETVKEFALIGFILLAVLFGMQIFTFIFGTLNQIPIEDETIGVTNESNVYINETGYTVSVASRSDFTGGVSIVSIYNGTGTYLIPSGNYTVNAGTGVITNATTEVFDTITGPGFVNITYNYNRKTEVEVVTEGNTNQSLRAIGNYSTQSGTQFTTLGVAITLILLVAVFLFFWKAFMGKGKGGEGGPGSFS